MKHDPSQDNAPLPVAERIAYLIAGFLRGSLTEAEHDELDAWVVASDENTRLFEELTDESNIEAALDYHKQLDTQGALRRVKETIGLRKPVQILLRTYLPFLSAAILLAVAISIYLVKTGAPELPHPVAQNTGNNNVPASHDQAVLTLGNGRTIILDSTAGNVVASEGGLEIKKGGDGALVYAGSTGENSWHTLSIPRGDQYKLVLSDGTTVWLNAQSSLRFPASFAAASREVELRGEAYFEVAKNAASPFRVHILSPAGDDDTVEVLGTHFNVNGYADDGIVKTTLLEGSVRVKKGNNSVVLKPGQQAQSGTAINVTTVNTDQEIAWKEGLFIFRDATIQDIGAQVARWYDIEPVYRGTITYHFNATMDRKESLSHLLDALQATQKLHFTLQGNKLIIEP